jgi:dTMP kinase
VPGRFITFEGIDGAGKSTHIEAVAAHLREGGHPVVSTREPGGTELAESLRSLILHAPMDALTETLLIFAARRDHVTTVIAPSLARGETVLCDRFTDATFAYQGAGRGFDAAVLTQREPWVQDGLQPDLTWWFDLEPAQALHRAAGARIPDRFDQQDLDFFERVRAGYRARQERHPARFARIDAGQERALVARQVAAALQARGW